MEHSWTRQHMHAELVYRHYTTAYAAHDTPGLVLGNLYGGSHLMFKHRLRSRPWRPW